ncbi:hypothetical protein SRABI112_05099 [Pseudomonas mediterranea]|nr:hypothetical protein SRABI112_05099 [Pseudomonas mediterranea]
MITNSVPEQNVTRSTARIVTSPAFAMIAPAKRGATRAEAFLLMLINPEARVNLSGATIVLTAAWYAGLRNALTIDARQLKMYRCNGSSRSNQSNAMTPSNSTARLTSQQTMMTR